MATLVAQAKRVLSTIAQQLYDARLARAEREVNRHYRHIGSRAGLLKSP
jgi:hypothetical protein